MKIVLISLVLISNFTLYAQWNQIKIFENNYHDFYLRHLDFATENDGMVAGVVQPFNTPFYQTAVYYTHDAGITWDSVFFDSVTPMGIDFVSNDVAYINTASIYPINGFQGVIRFVHRTLDGGISWTKHMVDTIGNGSRPKPIKFINDSVGVLTFSSGVYLTQNYGENWQKINPLYLAHPLVFKDNYIVNNGLTSFTLNLDTYSLDSINFDVRNGGSISNSDASGDTLLISSTGTDGIELGYPNVNYTSIGLDVFPFGFQKRVIHLRDITLVRDIVYHNGNIILSGSGAVIRSDNNVFSFFYQESTATGGMEFYDNGDLSFPSDSVGFVLSFHQQEHYYSVHKTTNLGGITNNYISNVLQISSLDEKQLSKTVSIFPNPSTNQVNINSLEKIENIMVYDMQGKQLVAFDDTELNTVIDFSSFNTGQYILVVKTEREVSTLKIIKL